jgi:hypothetical protein
MPSPCTCRVRILIVLVKPSLTQVSNACIPSYMRGYFGSGKGKGGVACDAGFTGHIGGVARRYSYWYGVESTEFRKELVSFHLLHKISIFLCI